MQEALILISLQPHPSRRALCICELNRKWMEPNRQVPNPSGTAVSSSPLALWGLQLLPMFPPWRRVGRDAWVGRWEREREDRGGRQLDGH